MQVTGQQRCTQINNFQNGETMNRAHKGVSRSPTVIPRVTPVNKQKISSEDVDKAMQEFLEKGGKIKKVETDWVEDGPAISVGYR